MNTDIGFDTTAASYRKLEIWLHDLALGNSFIPRALFNLDCDLTGIRKKLLSDNPVFVMGMARSGTTILLRELANTGAFAYLTYRHMPFVTAPILASRLARLRSKNLGMRQRSHGDGIAIALDSPEAFEEVIWRTIRATRTTEKTYIFNNIDKDQLNAFDLYRLQVIASAKSSTHPLRYLSKNNNNIGRLKHIAAIPGSKILMCIREPAATAVSSLKLHQTLNLQQQQNPFISRYMKYLGHHEFGQTHLRFDFTGANSVAGYQTTDINYWLEYWLLIHTELLSVLEKFRNVRLLVNSDMRVKPNLAISRALDFLEIENGAKTSELPASLEMKSTTLGTYHAELLSQAASVYAQLLNHSHNLMH